jgi:hypothetical protein
MDKNIINEEKEDIYIDIKSLPSPTMIIVNVLNFIKNNKSFIKLIKKYIKGDNIIYLFDEPNLTYSKNMSIEEYVNITTSDKKNVLSIIVSNKLSKEDSKKYLKVVNKIPIRVKITNTDQKTNNTKIYINIKTFSSIPVEKRIGIYKKLYIKYHELDDLLLISLNNLLKNILIDKHMKLYSKDQYKNINPLKNYKLISSSRET